MTFEYELARSWRSVAPEFDDVSIGVGGINTAGVTLGSKKLVTTAGSWQSGCDFVVVKWFDNDTNVINVGLARFPGEQVEIVVELMRTEGKGTSPTRH
jgi:hypothetical protein